jgi:hypothetical protein
VVGKIVKVLRCILTLCLIQCQKKLIYCPSFYPFFIPDEKKGSKTAKN